MEKRTLIAVVLSAFFLLAWYALFPPKPPVTVPVEQVQTQAETKIDENKAETPSPVPLPTDIVAETASTGSDVIVETDLYKAVLSTKGAVIKYWELKKYNDDKDMPVVLLKKPGAISPLSILFESSNRDLPQGLIYSSTGDRLVLSEGGIKDGEITFRYENQGVSISKRLIFHNDDYKVDVSIETANTPDYTVPVGTGFGIFDMESGMRTHAGSTLLIDAKLEKFTDKDSNKYLTGPVRWIAQEDKYFTAAIMPQTPVTGASFWKEADRSEIGFKLASGRQNLVLYAGPKEHDRLKNLNMGLEHIIDFGWFSIVAQPLFWALKFLHKYVGNYGWTIIIMTIIIRIPFIPLLQKSQQSMKKMQKIQPMMAEIKEQFKKDPQRQQKEMMELYKKHKVNPLGGCLPMLLQIPVFIALYNVLLQTIELRGAPFTLWITDLSLKDPFYILPIVMGLSMVVQQKMTPTTMDPTQAKIMMFLPIVFTVMFLNFPSGLVIYWFVNNLLAIGQQYFVNKQPE
ncbi:MAG: membrane protein insertase YidC [Nitrospirae bacterium]|nr:membrane protein insertase YidC [Nitrospirota bacterium]